MAIVIKVLKEFTEQRTRRTYKPGDVVTDEQWHDPLSRRAEAYAARGYVEIVEVPESGVGETLGTSGAHGRPVRKPAPRERAGEPNLPAREE